MTAAKRISLLNWPALLFMTAAVVLALVQLFPKQPAFRDPANLSAKDQLSIAYMRVLVRSDPANAALRLSFVRVLTEAGFDDEAQANLQPLLRQTPPDLLYETGLAQVRLDLQRIYRGTMNVEEEQTARRDIVHAFHRLLPLGWSNAEQNELLALARSFGEPTVLADLHQKMASDERVELMRRAELWHATGRYRLASADANAAAEAYTQAFDRLLLAQKSRDKSGWRSSTALPVLPVETVVQDALSAYLAANRLDKGLLFAKRVLPHVQHSAVAHELAANIAQGRGEDALALQWLWRVREIRQTFDPMLDERVLRLQLSLGFLSDALALAREWPQETITSLAQHRLLAQSFDWNNELSQALVHWQHMALTQADEEAETRAFAIAAALARDNDVVQLLEAVMLRRMLTATESEAYVTQGLRAVEPVRLADALQAYLKRQPRDRQGWWQLSRLQQARHYDSDAVAAAQKAQHLSRLSLLEKLTVAENYWRAQQAEPALSVLLGIDHAPPEFAVRYWRLLADLAWYLDREQLARSAYQQIVRHYAADDELALQRLIALAERRQDEVEIKRLAEYAWQVRRDRRYVIRLMDMADKAGDDHGLQRWLKVADALPAQFHDAPRYWFYRTRSLQLKGEKTAAQKSLLRLQSLRLHDAEILETVAWMYLAESESDKNESVKNALYQMAEREAFLVNENPGLSAVFAAMQHRLAQAGKAADYFLQTVNERHHDFFWTMTAADNLEWLGCAASANQVRVMALANVAATMKLWTRSPAQNALQMPKKMPHQLRDYFSGRADVTLPDDEDDALPWQQLAMQWTLPMTELDNARQYALRWQTQRMQRSEWEDFAEDLVEGNTAAVRERVARVAAQVQRFPLEPAAELTLTLNEVVDGRSRRADPIKNQISGADSDVCRQTVAAMQRWSDPIPVLAENKSP